MLQLQITPIEIDVMVSTIRRHQNTMGNIIKDLQDYQYRLKEILEAIEKRDIVSTEVQDNLDWVSEELKNLRKKIPLKIS
jgi:peptidoglycan hydrolase CwlO-like protein